MKKKYIVMLGGVLLLAGAGLGLLFGSIDMNQISRMLEDIPHGLREILMIVLIAAQIFLAFLPGEPLELAAGLAPLAGHCFAWWDLCLGQPLYTFWFSGMENGW